jgi:predicted nucleic acid-binding protein
VAIFSKRDAFHEVSVAQLREIAPPLITTWPVITEAVWLLGEYPPGLELLLKTLDRGLFELPVFSKGAASWLARFLKRYRKLGAQLADASLVYLAERDRLDTIFTLDRRDFSVYRFSRKRSFRILPAGE